MDYMFGRLALGILKVISWIALVLGILVAFGGAGGGFAMFVRQELGLALSAGYLGLIPGLVLALLAMISLAFLDHISATIDTAIWSKKTFRVSQQQLAVSKEALKLGKLMQAAQAPTEELAAGAPHSNANGSGSGRRFGLPSFLRRKADGETPQETAQRRQPQLTADTKMPSTDQQNPNLENDQAPASIEQVNEPQSISISPATPSVFAKSNAPPITLTAKPDGAE